MPNFQFTRIHWPHARVEGNEHLDFHVQEGRELVQMAVDGAYLVVLTREAERAVEPPVVEYVQPPVPKRRWWQLV